MADTKNNSQMLNFRAKDEFIERIDAAADALGLSRSDFIRQAVEERLGAIGPVARTRRPQQPKTPRAPKASAGGCPHPAAAVSRLATGVRLCGACGSRLR